MDLTLSSMPFLLRKAGLLRTSFISWIDGSEEQFKLARRDSLALNLTEDRDRTFNTPRWYNMALVAFLGSLSHFFKYQVMLFYSSVIVDDWDWFTISWK